MRSDIRRPHNIDRISIDPSDPDYREDHGDFVVLLDGSRVPYASSADTKKGEVFCTMTDEWGNPVAGEDEWIICKKTGHVEIKRVRPFSSDAASGEPSV